MVSADFDSPAAGQPMALLADRIEGALSAEPAMGERLEQVKSAVCLRLGGTRDAVTLLLDRLPVEVLRAGRDTEIEVELSAAQVQRLASGQLNLQGEILHGAATYRGPVRKLLSVMPILRALLQREAERNAAGEQLAELEASSAVRSWEFVERAPGDFWSIECCGLHKRFGREAVLSGVDLKIPEGMITVILGPSGTGKSVLLKHIIGLLFADKGEVLVRGRSLSRLRLTELLDLRRRYGILFQDGALFGSMNLYDNVAFPLRQHTDMTEAEIAEIVLGRLAQVGLGGAEQRLPAQLSGGMRKRAGLARALVLDPEIVLFDEPDSGLDPVRTALLCDLIATVHAENGGTFVVITHDIASARRIGEYVAILWQGKIVEAAPAEDIFFSKDPFVQQFLAGNTEGPLGMD